MGGIEHAICKIVRDGHLAGLGFAVDEWHVVTCAHVVNAALKPEGRELREHSVPPAGAELGVVFPIGLANSDADLTATLAPGGWLPSDPSRFEADDVALLRLCGKAPDELALRPSARAHGEVQLWGPITGRPAGVHVVGELLGEVAGRRLQVNVNDHGFQVRRGFSGGPVWHRDTGAILGMLAACGEGDADVYLIPVETISKVWPRWQDQVTLSGPRTRSAPDDRPGRPWTAAFARELGDSLLACRSMDDLRFRGSLLRRMGERLGMPGPFEAGSHGVPAIIRACEVYPEQGTAVAALAAAMKDLHPDCDALGRLEHCEAALKGLTALSTDELVPVLDVIADMPREYGYADFHELARRAAFGKVLPLRGARDLPGVVRRLNGARESTPARAPLVVRFLALLADSLEDGDRFRLEAEVEHIADGFGMSLSDIHADLAGSAPIPPEGRILQISVADISARGSQPRYTIEAAVFDVLPGRRERIGSWRFDRDCSLQDIDNSGALFLKFAGGLSRTAGARADTVVEFVLPWSLLGHPVEHWALDEDGYWIGYRFPVVVRSLDRQHNKWFYEPWLKRWKILVSEDDRSISDRIGWLHHGNVAMPEHAGTADRIIHLTGGYDITRWLARTENGFTAGLGLTFPYRYEDNVCLRGVQDAISQGIPLLVWCRDDSDVNVLERLLRNVKVGDLRETVHKWRCLTADGEDSAQGAMRGIVLLLDDPADATNPFERSFTSPQYGR